NAFDGLHRLELMSCAGMTCKEFSIENQKSFAQFIKQIKKVDLTKSTDMNDLINEQFVCDIGGSTLDQFLCNFNPYKDSMTQRKMERKMVGVSLRDRWRNERVRGITKLRDW
ncbi:hypothetical protein PENTCL1PPCAC_1323, partial [Pristionchus entomophagus]